jgi:hypothetical protein
VYNSPDVLSPFLLLTLHQFLISPKLQMPELASVLQGCISWVVFRELFFFSFCCNLQLAQICDRIFTS